MAAATVEQTAAVDLGTLLDCGPGTVVTLVVGQTRLTAHRAVLAARSPVFAAMFAHDTLEAATGEVTIDDMEADVLRQLITYLYTGRGPELPSSMAPKLLAAANKYMVALLKDWCEQQLMEQLSVENAAATAVLSVVHSCSRLTRAAVAFVAINFREVMGTQGWREAVFDRPKHLVQFTDLLAESSADVKHPVATAGHSRTGTFEAAVAAVAIAANRTFSRGRRALAQSYGYFIDVDDIMCLQNLPPKEKQCILWEAASEGDVEEAEAVLLVGAEVNSKSQNGQTALHWATENGHPAVVQMLVREGADVNCKNRLHETPLHIAARYDYPAVASVLLQAGADRLARDMDGKNPLDVARLYNHKLLVQMLQ